MTYITTPGFADVSRLWDQIGTTRWAWQCKACGTVQYTRHPHGHFCKEVRLKNFAINAATDQDINNRFDYHAPDADRKERHEALRDNLRKMAQFVCELVPAGRERSLAITKLEEAMFWGNAGIARAGHFQSPPPPHGGPAANEQSTA